MTLKNMKIIPIRPVSGVRYSGISSQPQNPGGHPGLSGVWMAMWVIMAEAENVKKLEKWAVEKVWQTTGRPLNYYVHPFDFGRSIMFRIVLMVPRADQEAVQKVLSMFGEMTNVAGRYGAIPLRHKAYLGNYLDLTGTYADVLGRIKKTLVPIIFSTET